LSNRPGWVTQWRCLALSYDEIVDGEQLVGELWGFPAVANGPRKKPNLGHRAPTYTTIHIRDLLRAPRDVEEIAEGSWFLPDLPLRLAARCPVHASDRLPEQWEVKRERLIELADLAAGRARSRVDYDWPVIG
jgi:hypothetical protein